MELLVKFNSYNKPIVYIEKSRADADKRTILNCPINQEFQSANKDLALGVGIKDSIIKI